ncbi:MAG: type III pantothenate kinase [Ferrimicrobium sp.]
MAVTIAIDVGNTQTVIGCFEGSRRALEQAAIRPKAADVGLRFHLRLSTQANRTADEYFLLLSQFFHLHGLDDLDEIDGVVVSSSAPSVTATVVDMVRRWLRQEPLVLTPGIDVGMPIRYENPREVGADRIADAVAAIDLYDTPVIVVDFGTATTFDAISGSGEYLGGAIAPGIEVALDALVSRAAALRKVELVPPPAVIGRTTVESMQAGVLFGAVGQVTGIVTMMKKLLGPATVLATGGLCSVIAPHAQIIDHEEPWLTLHGLRLILARS